jgi:hypothetical protein
LAALLLGVKAVGAAVAPADNELQAALAAEPRVSNGARVHQVGRRIEAMPAADIADLTQEVGIVLLLLKDMSRDDAEAIADYLSRLDLQESAPASEPPQQPGD